jgi:hypothetical protein
MMKLRRLSIFCFLILVFVCGVMSNDEQCVMNEEGVCIVPREQPKSEASEQVELQQPSETLSANPREKIAKGSNADGAPPEPIKECVDRYPEQCAQWVAVGECEKNPGWMIINCGGSCQNCHLRDPKLRCDRKFLNISTEPIYKPGDMDDMFSSLEKDFGDRYGISILSTSPWIVRFDNFVTDEEIEAILTSVKDNWERSTDTGKTNEFGETGRVLSTSRTSNNAWCRRECEDNPLVQNVVKKIGEITRIPKNNYESFQILRYEPGQYYRTHHDMGE